MNKFVYALPLIFAFACGDKEEDTAAEEVEEVEEAEDTGAAEEEAEESEEEGEE